MEQIEEQLSTELFALIEKREAIPLNREEDNGNIVVRCLNNEADNTVTIVTEVKHVQDLQCEDFAFFFQNWEHIVMKLNPSILEMTECEPVEGIKVSKSLAKCPWPLSNRLSFVARYPRMHFRPNEHLFMVSVRGAESRIVLNDKEKEELALAKVKIGGWWISPYDKDNLAAGVRIFNVQNSEAGGNIPSAVTNKVAPGQVVSTINNLLAMLRKRKVEQAASVMLESLNNNPKLL